MEDKHRNTPRQKVLWKIRVMWETDTRPTESSLRKRYLSGELNGKKTATWTWRTLKLEALGKWQNGKWAGVWTTREEWQEECHVLLFFLKAVSDNRISLEVGDNSWKVIHNHLVNIKNCQKGRQAERFYHFPQFTAPEEAANHLWNSPPTSHFSSVKRWIKERKSVKVTETSQHQGAGATDFPAAQSPPFLPPSSLYSYSRWGSWFCLHTHLQPQAVHTVVWLKIWRNEGNSTLLVTNVFTNNIGSL